MKFMLYFAVLWILLQTAECDWEDGKEIRCFHLGSECPMNEICKGRCRFSCKDFYRYPVWGSATYTYDSPICRAATHDRRISTWDLSKRNVVFKRTLYSEKYRGSIRFGISTVNYERLSFASSGSFVFLNPRIKEKILDVASLHSGFIFQQEPHVQRCYGANNALSRKFEFTTFIPRGDKPHILQPADTVSGNPLTYTKNWSSINGEADAGGFQCVPEKSMLSILTSVAMSADADFLPASLTVTANINEDVTLVMNDRPRALSCGTTWEKDEKTIPWFIPAFRQRTSLILRSIEEGSQGLYSLKCDSSLRPGVMRLIVRVCEKDKYGENCSEQCPECKNGGVCHDIIGDCICPPGFNGTYCENACPSGYFGRTCSMSCPESNDLPLCSGYLICLPDPYGCSCGSGYKGIFCNESCNRDEFGAGCSQKRICHCSSDEPCNKFSGLCPSGCSDGWHGDGCSISYPVLSAPPVFLNASKSTIELSFREWNPSVDIGNGTPSNYTVYYKKEGSPEFKMVQNRIALYDAENRNYAVSLSDLKPYTKYTVRVVITDSSGNSRTDGIKTSEFYTACDQPLAPPSDVEITAEERTVSIKWKLPPKDQWNCDSLTAVVKYNSSDKENITSGRNSFYKKIESGNYYNFSSKPFTMWNIIVCLGHDSNDDADFTCAAQQNVATKEDAPGTVEDFQYINVGSRSLNLTWEDPSEKNGEIKHFILRYKQIGWAHDCNCVESCNGTNRELNVTSRKITVRRLNPSAIYSFSISAVTVKEGPSATIEAATKEDVPSAVLCPTNLKIDEEEFGKIVLSWKQPPCNMTNGNITYYWVKIKILRLSKQEVGNKRVSSLQVDFSVLPYTEYNAKVYPSTSIGYGPVYSESNFRTKPTAPSAPSDFSVASQTRNSLYVKWLPPFPPNGKLLKYTIIYGAENNIGHWDSVTVPAVNNKCNYDRLDHYYCLNLTDLHENTTYIIRVAAWNEDVEQIGESAVTRGKPTDLLPGPPDFITVKRKSETSVDIAWRKPTSSNGNLLHYGVSISVKTNEKTGYPETKETKEVLVYTNQYTFTNLQPATTYRISVRTYTLTTGGPQNVIEANTSVSVPVVDRMPQYVGTTKDSITIKIFSVKSTGGATTSAYYVIVQMLFPKRRHKRYATRDLFAPNYCLPPVFDSQYQYTTGRINIVPNGEIYFTIGDGECVDGYFNIPLDSDTGYRIGIAVESKYGDDIQRSQITYISETIFVENPVKANTYEIVLGVLIFLIIVVCVLIFLCVKLPHIFLKPKEEATQLKNLVHMKAKMTDLSYANASLEPDDEAIDTESLSEDINCTISVERLEEYTLASSKNGELKKQHKAVPKGQIFPCNAARIPQNKPKNRYGNLLAYDHSRVLLEPIPGEPHSDYINANYVSGYKREKKYIATQGPLARTVNDFWRMMWKEKSCKIIMATNIVEGGRIKCDKYWPDDSTDSTYGNITVTLKHSEPLADYVIRTFEIDNGKEKREIKHFHFLTWPDHGVPMYTSPVVKFLKKARCYQPDSKAAVIVHCSAGVGRTGTLILLDSMLEMGAAEGLVDVCGHLCLMRRERNNIVENLEQYVFVYKALVQALCWGETSVLCADLIPQMQNLRTPDPDNCFTPLEMQYQRLGKICPQLDNAAIRVARDPTNVPKNRTMEILPPERARPILKSRPGVESTYINAVYINGYHEKDAFIATQFPLPHTISDFWRMIRDTESRTIVLLQYIDYRNSTCPQYWPPEGQTVIYDEHQIQCTSLDVHGDIYVWNLTLSILDSTEDTSVPVKLFHHLNWALEESLPQHTISILNLIDMVEKAQQQLGKHVITVQCLNGATACGVFCAAMFLCNKMINEQEVDPFQAVQSVRTNRPQFIESFEQYDFLYNMAIAFLDNFGAYANFL